MIRGLRNNNNKKINSMKGSNLKKKLSIFINNYLFSHLKVKKSNKKNLKIR